MNTFETLKKFFSKKYNTKNLGKVKTIIRWQIDQDTTLRTMKISQSVFIQDLIIKKELMECNTNVILIKISFAIEMTKSEDYKEADFYTYQWLIGKLIYLVYGTRLDISFVVGQLSRYNVDLRKSYFQVAKRVVWYLHKIIEISLMYSWKLNNQMPRHPPLISLIRFADSSFARYPEDRKSVIGYCFFLNGAVVLWCNKKQKTVLISTTKAEYIAFGHAARKAV